jgi:hypothetical protein
MPRKKSVTVQTPMSSGDWWLDACRAFGWIPEYYTPPPQVQQSTVEVKTQYSTEPIQYSSLEDAEMREFCRRVVEALCPPDKGYHQMYVDLAKKIYDVIEGKMDFAEWFTSVRQTFGLKPIDLAQLIYVSLQGFRSQAAVKLREEWWEYLKMLMQAYGPVIT